MALFLIPAYKTMGAGKNCGACKHHANAQGVVTVEEAIESAKSNTDGSNCPAHQQLVDPKANQRRIDSAIAAITRKVTAAANAITSTPSTRGQSQHNHKSSHRRVNHNHQNLSDSLETVATRNSTAATPASIKPHNNNSPKRSWQDWFTQAGKVTLGVACVALAALMAQKAVPVIIKALATPQQCAHGCAHSH